MIYNVVDTNIGKDKAYTTGTAQTITPHPPKSAKKSKLGYVGPICYVRVGV